MSWRTLVTAVLILMWSVMAVGFVRAQGRSAATAPSGAPGGPGSTAGRELSLLTLIHYSGPIGYLIIAISFVAVALVIEDVRSIRRDRLMPPRTVLEVKKYIAQGQFREALVRCEQDDSFLSSVVGAGLSALGSGTTDFAELQTVMTEAGEQQASRLYRKIEYLSLIGNIAPMLGFLGTVTGMIIAFNEIAVKADRVRPADLAYGVSQALVTTVEGLVVAIPVMSAFVLLRNRIDALVGEAETVVAQITARLKHLGAPKGKREEKGSA